jgi:hypothetical protein
MQWISKTPHSSAEVILCSVVDGYQIFIPTSLLILQDTQGEAKALQVEGIRQS